MKIKLLIDSQWTELETKQVIVSSDDGTPLAALGEIKPGSFVAAMASDPDFRVVLSMLGQELRVKITRINIGSPPVHTGPGLSPESE